MFYLKGEIDGLMKQHPHLVHPSQRQAAISGHISEANQPLRQPASQPQLMSASFTACSQQVQQHLKQTNVNQKQPPPLHQQEHSQPLLQHHPVPHMSSLRHQSHSTTTYYQQQHLQQQKQYQEQYRRYSSQLPAQPFAGISAGQTMEFCAATFPLPITTSMSATGVSSPSLSPHAYQGGHLMQRNPAISGSGGAGHAMESSNHTPLYNARQQFQSHHYPGQQQQSQRSFSSSEEDMHPSLSGHLGYLLTPSNFSGSHLLARSYDYDYDGK